MRKIVVGGLFISLDGVTESPDQWQGDAFDAVMFADMTEQLATLDAVLMGRVTYEEFASYWPTASDDAEPYKSFINNAPKYIVSTTLDKVDWQNSTLIKGNLAEELTKLKQQPGKNIGIQGSPTLVQSLLQQDLLDELRLAVHPVVVGKGKRLFKDGSDLKRLKLVDSKTTSTGVLLLTYRPAERA
jgi:dihydrofolate reductase